LISGKKGMTFSDDDLSVNISYMTETEQQYVHDFISWEDRDKNIALSNIVFTCLEYCLLVNGDKPNKLLEKSIRKREIYLDTNIIFRALGINGPNRYKTINAFLKKCRQARLKIIISYNTKKEFFDTMEYYLEEIRRYPRGNVYTGAYEQLSDYSLFNHYEEWRKSHPGMSLIYYKLSIQSAYEKMVHEYSIVDGERIPDDIYNSDQFKQVRNTYSSAIKKIKDDLHDRYVSEDDRYSLKDSHDATLVHYVECRRKEKLDSDVFVVSSDKILRYWDLSNLEREYPVVIYPSQLFLVLIKTCGRSDNDYDSFVNFINVRSAHQQMSAEKANAIISGISVITEDIVTQEVLISAICSGAYQNIIKNTQDNDALYEAIQEVCKKHLEEELKEKDSMISSLKENENISNERITALEENVQGYEKEISSLKEQVDKQALDINEKEQIINNNTKEIVESKRVNETYKENIYEFAQKKTRLSFALKWYVFPAITVFLIVSYILFVAFQFIACDAEWNFVTRVVELIGQTTFGKSVNGYIAVVDSAVFILLVTIIVPNFFVKPWDNEKRDLDKQNRIERYIKNNKLL